MSKKFTIFVQSILSMLLLSFITAQAQDITEEAAKGNLAAVKTYIAQGVDINLKDEKGATALYKATAAGNKEVVLLLLSKNADVNISNISGRTPLMKAAEKGWLDVVRIMIENGADVNAKLSRFRGGVLEFAVKSGRKNLVEFLIEQGADVNDIEGLYPIPLSSAIRLNNLELTKLLVSKGAIINPPYNEMKKVTTGPITVNIPNEGSYIPQVGQSSRKLRQVVTTYNITNIHRQSPLSTACRTGAKDMIHFLLSKGARLYDREKSRNELADILLYHASKGNIEVAEMLFALRIDGYKPVLPSDIHRYLGGRDKQTVNALEFLCRHGVDLELRNYKGLTPLMNAASEGRTELVKILIDYGADINAQYEVRAKNRNYWGRFTALIFCCDRGQVSTAKLLLERGADPDLQDYYGRTAAHHAVSRNKIELADLLIQNGADLDLSDKGGNTPLCQAFRAKRVNMARFLIKNTRLDAKCLTDIHNQPLVLELLKEGEDFLPLDIDICNLTDKERLRLLSIASKYEAMGIIKQMIRQGVPVDVKTHLGKTALFLASENGHIELVKHLIASGADVNFADHKGITPLMKAVEHGHSAIVYKLIEHGANVNARNNIGGTPIMYSIHGGYKKISELLKSHGAQVEDYLELLTKQEKLKELFLLEGSDMQLPLEFGDFNNNMAPDNILLLIRTFKIFGIDDLTTWSPDPRLASPEKTWDTYTQALQDHNLELARKCFLQQWIGKKYHETLFPFGPERIKRIAQNMRPIEKIESNRMTAKYRIKSEKRIPGLLHDISNYIHFIYLFGEWRIERY